MSVTLSHSTSTYALCFYNNNVNSLLSFLALFPLFMFNFFLKWNLITLDIYI